MISLNDILFGFSSVPQQSLWLCEQKGIDCFSLSSLYACDVCVSHLWSACRGFYLAVKGRRTSHSTWESVTTAERSLLRVGELFKTPASLCTVIPASMPQDSSVSLDCSFLLIPANADIYHAENIRAEKQSPQIQYTSYSSSGKRIKLNAWALLHNSRCQVYSTGNLSSAFLIALTLPFSVSLCIYLSLSPFSLRRSHYTPEEWFQRIQY